MVKLRPWQSVHHQDGIQLIRLSNLAYNNSASSGRDRPEKKVLSDQWDASVSDAHNAWIENTVRHVKSDHALELMAEQATPLTKKAFGNDPGLFKQSYFLVSFMTVPSQRRKGLATALLQEMFKIADGKGLKIAFSLRRRTTYDLSLHYYHGPD